MQAGGVADLLHKLGTGLLDMTRRGHRCREGQHTLSCSLPLSPVHLGATWESALPPGPPTECAVLQACLSPHPMGGVGKPQLRELKQGAHSGPARLCAGRPAPTHMSGECRVCTCPAYSSLSSMGMSTRRPSFSSSLSMMQERGAEGRR